MLDERFMKKVFVYVFALAIISAAINAKGQPTGWTVNPSDFANSMTFTWQVSLPDDEPVTIDDYMAAFVNGECRGVVSAIELNNSGDFYFLLLVHSNNTVGDEISFRFYNASSEEVVEIPETITFESEKISGSFTEPNVFVIEQDIVLSVGDEELFKVNIYPNPAENQIKVKSDPGDQIKVTVVDMNGAVLPVPSTSFIEGETIFDISQIKSGIYFIVISTPTHFSSKKFIKL